MVLGRFDGRSVLVTGAGSGIGRAIALQMAREGAALALLDIDETGLTRIKQDLEQMGSKVMSLRVDVADRDRFAAAIADAIAGLGVVDALVNNVGIAGEIKPIESMSLSTWDRVMATTLTSVFLATKTVLPHMLRAGRGSIVNIASVSGIAADVGLSAYNTAKAGVINFTRATAVEYSDRGIRANCVCPGAIATPPVMQMFDVARSPAYARRKREMEASHPMNRMGQPEEVAEVVCFLASDAASFVSGAAYTVDGGLMAATGMPPLPVGAYKP